MLFHVNKIGGNRSLSDHIICRIICSTEIVYSTAVYNGNPAYISSSKKHSFAPRSILKRPFSPQYVLNELTANQYGTPFSSPQPITLTAWTVMYLPDLYAYTPIEHGPRNKNAQVLC